MSNVKDVRMKNSLKMLREFLTGNEYTKNEIAEKVGLTLVTSCKIMNKMLANGVLVEKGIADSDCGRKASVYVLNAEQFYICGLAVGLDFYHIEVIDLTRKVLFAQKTQLDSTLAFSAVMPTIISYMKEVLDDLHIENSQLLGIGVTVPGIVDPVKGQTVVLPNMPTWNHAPIKEMLEKEFQTLVIMEKDNYASILYLKAINTNRLSNAIVMTIMGGIGCGILIDGAIYRGADGLAGEIGHICLGTDKDAQTLENYASDTSIVRRIRAMKLNHGEELDPEFGIAEAVQAARKGDEDCQKVFAQAMVQLQYALILLVRLYNPRQIFIDSFWVRSLPKAFATLNNALKQLDGALPNCNVKLVCIKEENTVMKGASMLVYDYVMNHSTQNKLINF